MTLSVLLYFVSILLAILAIFFPGRRLLIASVLFLAVGVVLASNLLRMG